MSGALAAAGGAGGPPGGPPGGGPPAPIDGWDVTPATKAPGRPWSQDQLSVLIICALLRGNVEIIDEKVTVQNWPDVRAELALRGFWTSPYSIRQRWTQHVTRPLLASLQARDRMVVAGQMPPWPAGTSLPRRIAELYNLSVDGISNNNPPPGAIQPVAKQTQHVWLDPAWYQAQNQAWQQQNVPAGQHYPPAQRPPPHIVPSIAALVQQQPLQLQPPFQPFRQQPAIQQPAQLTQQQLFDQWVQDKGVQDTVNQLQTRPQPKQKYDLLSLPKQSHQSASPQYLGNQQQTEDAMLTAQNAGPQERYRMELQHWLQHGQHHGAPLPSPPQPTFFIAQQPSPSPSPSPSPPLSYQEPPQFLPPPNASPTDNSPFLPRPSSENDGHGPTDAESLAAQAARAAIQGAGGAVQPMQFQWQQHQQQHQQYYQPMSFFENVPRSRSPSYHLSTPPPWPPAGYANAAAVPGQSPVPPNPNQTNLPSMINYPGSTSADEGRRIMCQINVGLNQSPPTHPHQQMPPQPQPRPRTPEHLIDPRLLAWRQSLSPNSQAFSLSRQPQPPQHYPPRPFGAALFANVPLPAPPAPAQQPVQQGSPTPGPSQSESVVDSVEKDNVSVHFGDYITSPVANPFGGDSE